MQWSQMPPSLATWETLESLKQCFPRAPVWGHADFKGGGIVSTAISASLNGSLKMAWHQEGSQAGIQESRPGRSNNKLAGSEWEA